MTRIKQTPLPTPIKGKADWRNYKAFRLENGVTCLIIHDKESKTTAMSCIVEVGASSDPRELSGLAHFCEHMCFLGSEKYPGENEYKRYLSSHGGRSNASTSMHVTNYKFEVLADHAEKAVDIFSNFFVAPLFTSSGTEREVQAVSSENSKNLTADGRRRLQILKDLADPNHYYSKFSTGNSQTLPTDTPEKLQWIRKALLAFHRRHYRPEKMTVVIAGPQSIETLEEWVGERYSKITSNDSNENITNDELEILIADAAKDAPPYGFQDEAPPYNPAFKASLENPWPVLLTTRPLRSMRNISMMFPIPSDRKTPDRAPSAMLSHLLGHEGIGSAFATLQNNGWLSSLSSGARTAAPDFTLFQVRMGLTEKGEENWKEAVKVVFDYCRLLQNEATKLYNGKNEDSVSTDELNHIWKEMSDLNKIFFDETSPSGAYIYAPMLCDRVVSYGTEACISAGSMLKENKDSFPMEDFVKLTKLLTPQNCIIERSSEGAYQEMEAKSEDDFPDGFGLKKEKWYGVEYFLSPIGNKTVSEWTKCTNDNLAMESNYLSLPKPNRYIPRTLELCPELPDDAKKGQRIEKPIDPPCLLVDEGNFKLFYRLEDRYALPKSSLHLLIRNMSLHYTKDAAGEWIYNPEAALFSSFLAGIFNEAMAQETYDAGLAGLHWSLSIGSSGIKLNCFGFSDRLPDLALKVLGDFLSGEFLSDEKFFVSTRDRAVRGFRTYFTSRRADSHAMYYIDSLLASKDEGIQQSLDIAISAKYDDVVKHHQNILRDTERSVECLLNGNVSSKEAKDFFASAKTKILAAYNNAKQNTTLDKNQPIIHPGMVERQLQPGQEIELHFTSQNPEEENGAVLCSYQSSIPSFKGDKLSHPLALHSSSSIRLLCHIMQEPLFDSLRTKQQLGYIVRSSYTIGVASQSNVGGQIPQVTPVDFMTISVLSKKIPPPDIVQRIDEFLQTFRTSLETMPESEIRDHADALATKLLKPIQKLQTEASSQYFKIQRYGPEVFHRRKNLTGEQGSPSDTYEIPWDNTQALASTIRGLSRKDLLHTFDRMTLPSTRSRVVSCVYGKKHPLTRKSADNLKSSALKCSIWGQLRRPVATTTIVDSFPDLLNLRRKLPNFSGSGRSYSSSAVVVSGNSNVEKWVRWGQKNHRGVLVLSLLGATLMGLAAASNRRGKEDIPSKLPLSQSS